MAGAETSRPSSIPVFAGFAGPVDIASAWKAEAFGEPISSGHRVVTDDLVLADRVGVILVSIADAENLLGRGEARDRGGDGGSHQNRVRSTAGLSAARRVLTGLATVIRPADPSSADPVVFKAFLTICRLVDVSDGRFDSRDRKFADEIVRILVANGHTIQAGHFKHWALARGWKAYPAAELDNLATSIAANGDADISNIRNADSKYRTWLDPLR